ncbi:MAG: hypothetical protein K8R21_09370, partial [Leptospira sp.]|nr:hypothetical protein [Leptospira sp.]
MKQSGVHSKIFFLIYFIFILQFSQCSEEEKIQEDSAKVNDLPWDGNSTSIPAAMKESNPSASGNAL